MFEIYYNNYERSFNVEDLTTKISKPLKDMGYTFFHKIESHIKDFYPEAYEILTQLYGNDDATIFGRVNHFINCNFYLKTGKPNINENWDLTLQHIHCPARITKTCDLKNKLCHLEKKSFLSEREIEVLRFFAFI